VVLGGETQGGFKMIGGRYSGRGPGTESKGNSTALVDTWR
jgi:hypothetical protein